MDQLLDRLRIAGPFELTCWQPPERMCMPLLCRWILRTMLKSVACVAAMAMISGMTLRSPSIIACRASKAFTGTIAERVVFPEVRLRKLHLVRPDLIPYPIYYEIYC